MQQEPDGSCFSLHSLLLDHQGKVPAQTMTIKEMPIKKYFTLLSPRNYCYAWMTSLHLIQWVTPGKTTLKVLYFTVGITPEFELNCSRRR